MFGSLNGGAAPADSETPPSPLFVFGGLIIGGNGASGFVSFRSNKDDINLRVADGCDGGSACVEDTFVSHDDVE